MAHKSAEKMAEVAQRVYQKYGERAAMRSALGDAAGLCDALARDIRTERTKRGRIKKADLELAQQIELVGNEIWAMRDLIHVEDHPAPGEVAGLRHGESRGRSSVEAGKNAGGMRAPAGPATDS